MAEKSPAITVRVKYGTQLRYTGYKNREPQGDLNSGSEELRPIDYVPATPSTWMGYAGRNSETELGQS